MIRTLAIAALIVAPSAPVRAEPIVATPAEQAQLDAMKQPEAWFIANLKGPREVSDGVVLDARLQWVLENVTRPSSVPAVQAYLRNSYKTPEGRAATRMALERYWALRTAPGAQMAVEDRTVSGRDGNAIPIRVYRPEGLDMTAPLIVYYHGGGFMFGSLDAFDPSLRMMAAEARAVVVSVGYRLAPEHPYPAAWNDAEDAYDWVLANFGGKRIGLAGDSAGGTLAIATALRAREGGKSMPAGLLLFYPGVDREGDYPSMKALGSGYGLDADNLKYLADQVYPAGSTTTAADTSPMQADLCGLPPVRMVSAGFDPLKDSQAAFVKALSQADCPTPLSTSYGIYGNLIHAFLQTTGYVPDADAAARQEARDFGDALRVSVDR